MQYDFDYQFAPDGIGNDAEFVTLMTLPVPDGTTVRVLAERFKGWDHDSVVVSFDRDGVTTLTGQGHSVYILKTVAACLQDFIRVRNPQHVLFAYRAAEGRESLYRRLSERILWGTHMRWLEDPWDDFYRVHSGVLDFLNMVADAPNFKMHVIQRVP